MIQTVYGQDLYRMRADTMRVMNILQEGEAKRLRFCNIMAPYPQQHEILEKSKDMMYLYNY